MRSEDSCKGGFTLIEVMIVVAIIALIMAVAVPHFMRIRTNAQTKACIANLGQIESAKQIWGVENRRSSGALPTQADLVPRYLKTPPVCPALGVYDFKPIGQNPTCTVAGHTLGK
jgi:prepilin-type N-terminal cleavage/methylation domain-containing protein